MIDNSDLWLKRAEEIDRNAQDGTLIGSEAVQFATPMLTALYGPESPQLRQFRDGYAATVKTSPNARSMENNILVHAIGAIRSTKAEIEAGLIVRLRVAVAGEILTELIRLAKEIMADRTEEAKKTPVRSWFQRHMKGLCEEWARSLQVSRLVRNWRK